MKRSFAGASNGGGTPAHIVVIGDDMSGKKRTVSPKANGVYKTRRNVKDELKRQATLAAEAAAVASSPEYIANLTLQMKASEKRQTIRNKEKKMSGSLDTVTGAAKLVTPTEQRAKPCPMTTIGYSTLNVKESQEVEEVDRIASTGQAASPPQQKPRQKSDLYYEQSPMCRLRNISTAPRAPAQYQHLRQNRNQNVNDSVCQDIQKNCGDISDTIESVVCQEANDENCSHVHNISVKNSEKVNGSEKSAEQSEKPALTTAAVDIVGNILTRSINVPNDNNKLLTVQTSNSMESAKAQNNLLGFINRDFGNTERSLLTLSDPRTKIEQSLSRESQFASNSATMNRRADRIENHRSNVGSTLKSVGIALDLNRPIASVNTKKASSTSIITTKPKKKRPTLSTIISPKRDTNCHRREVYEMLRTKRCLQLQSRRGVAVPRVGKVSYQCYSFLERQRRGILETGLIKSCDVVASSGNTVVSMDSASSSYCDEMLAHAYELRKARLTFKKLSTPLTRFASSESTTNASCTSGNSEMVAQVVKRRKARLSTKLSTDLGIGRTMSSDTEATSASAKRRRAMEKIRRNKVKALQREADC